MKTLINKNNPAIRITASGIEFVHSTPIDYWRVREVGCYAANAWELKEEETIVKTIVDLEKDVESWFFNEISSKINVENTMYHYFQECARRYFELGLNARKQ